jgi:peroxiredoxin
MIKKILVITLSSALLFAYSCKQTAKGKFSVIGTYNNADKLILPGSDGKISAKIFLVEVSYGKDQNPVAVDSGMISGNSGMFHLTGKGNKEGIYELLFGDNLLAIPIVNDASEIKIDADLSKKDDFYEVSGSDATKNLQSLISNFGKKNYAVGKDFADIDSLKKANAPDSLVIAATTVKNNAMTDLNDYLKNFIQTNKNATIMSLALSWASRSFSQEDFEGALNASVKKYPTNDVIVNMKKNYDMQKAQAQQAQQQSAASSLIGQQAPELGLPDVNGNIVSLASFKGKYLLIDFWASWCGPCRAENPNVVKAFGEFKDKNFAILGVSLDKDKDAWQQAVKADNLAWAQVSDLKYWNSKAVGIYKFEGIPFNVLVDPQGKIIGQELRGADLVNKLKEVLQ